MQKIMQYGVSLLPSSFIELSLPKGAKILTAQNFKDTRLCLWAEVDLALAEERRFFHIYRTGDALQENCEEVYVSTVQSPYGGGAYHLYELVNVNTASP